MPPTPPLRVLVKKNQKLNKKAKAISGFDYPTTIIGQSKWKGSDGRPVTVYYDPATGAQGKAAALYLLSKIDDVMTACDVWFGVKGASGNCIVAPDFGGKRSRASWRNSQPAALKAR